MAAKKKKHIILKIIGIAAALGVLCYLCVFGVVCVNEQNLPEIENYNAIVILGAQIKQDGTPDVQLQWRLDKGIEMYTANRCPIVVCGGQGSDEPRPEGVAMQEYLAAKGIPESDILVDSTSSNTRQNIRHALQLLDGRNVTKVLIVTSNYHLPRSLAIARDEGMDACGVGSPIKSKYWLKNHARETLSMIKYWAEKYHILPTGE